MEQQMSEAINDNSNNNELNNNTNPDYNNANNNNNNNQKSNIVEYNDNNNNHNQQQQPRQQQHQQQQRASASPCIEQQQQQQQQQQQALPTKQYAFHTFVPQPGRNNPIYTNGNAVYLNNLQGWQPPVHYMHGDMPTEQPFNSYGNTHKGPSNNVGGNRAQRRTRGGRGGNSHHMGGRRYDHVNNHQSNLSHHQQQRHAAPLLETPVNMPATPLMTFTASGQATPTASLLQYAHAHSSHEQLHLQQQQQQQHQQQQQQQQTPQHTVSQQQQQSPRDTPTYAPNPYVQAGPSTYATYPCSVFYPHGAHIVHAPGAQGATGTPLLVGPLPIYNYLYNTQMGYMFPQVYNHADYQYLPGAAPSEVGISVPAGEAQVLDGQVPENVTGTAGAGAAALSTAGTMLQPQIWHGPQLYAPPAHHVPPPGAEYEAPMLTPNYPVYEPQPMIHELQERMSTLQIFDDGNNLHNNNNNNTIIMTGEPAHLPPVAEVQQLANNMVENGTQTMENCSAEYATSAETLMQQQMLPVDVEPPAEVIPHESIKQPAAVGTFYAANETLATEPMSYQAPVFIPNESDKQDKTAQIVTIPEISQTSDEQLPEGEKQEQEQQQQQQQQKQSPMAEIKMCNVQGKSNVQPQAEMQAKSQPQQQKQHQPQQKVQKQEQQKSTQKTQSQREQSSASNKSNHKSKQKHQHHEAQQQHKHNENNSNKVSTSQKQIQVMNANEFTNKQQQQQKQTPNQSAAAITSQNTTTKQDDVPNISKQQQKQPKEEIKTQRQPQTQPQTQPQIQQQQQQQRKPLSYAGVCNTNNNKKPTMTVGVTALPSNNNNNNINIVKNIKNDANKNTINGDIKSTKATTTMLQTDANATASATSAPSTTITTATETIANMNKNDNNNVDKMNEVIPSKQTQQQKQQLTSTIATTISTSSASITVVSGQSSVKNAPRYATRSRVLATAAISTPTTTTVTATTLELKPIVTTDVATNEINAFNNETTIVSETAATTTATGIIDAATAEAVVSLAPPNNTTTQTSSPSWASLFSGNVSKTNNINNNKMVSSAEQTTTTTPTSTQFNGTIFNNSNSNSNNNNKKTTNKRTAMSAKAVPNVVEQKRKRSMEVDANALKYGDFLAKYKTDLQDNRLVPRGLTNRSNYCYINAILQALISCPPFINLFKSMPNRMEVEGCLSTPLTHAMTEFVQQFNTLPENVRTLKRKDGKNGKEDSSPGILIDSPFEPTDIYKLWNECRPNNVQGRQEDAEEFLSYVLNRLNDEMVETIKLIDPVTVNGQASSEDTNDWHTIRNTRNKSSITRQPNFGRSPVSDIFRGEHRSRLYREGEHYTDEIQPFYTLPLNIAVNKTNTVRDALELMVNRNQVDGLLGLKSKQAVTAWQQIMLEKLPTVLILHLKCFDLRSDGECTKLLKRIEYPLELKIFTKILANREFSQKQRKYRLFAVVYHEGTEIHKGHYITDVYHVGYKNWLRYDDSSVTPIEEEQVLHPPSPRVPYLLFYRRCDTLPIYSN